jgi:hypothetical protein
VAVLSPEQQRKLADLARSGLPDDVAQEAALYGFIAPPQRDYDRTQRFGGNVPIKNSHGPVAPEKTTPPKKGKQEIPPIR